MIPKYIRVGKNGTVMIRSGKMEYYRDAGCWTLKVKWDGDKLVANTCNSFDHPAPMHHLKGIPLIPTTKAKWLEDNRGYV